MWKLFKSEMKYFKWLYILSIVLVIIINFGLTIDGRWIEAQNDFPGIRSIWLGTGIVVLFFTILFNRQSGRIRNNMLLPISIKHLAIIRYMGFVIFWIALLIILTIFYFINFNETPTQNWILNLVSITGIILLVNSMPVLNSDFYSTYFSKKSKITLGIIWGVFFVIYIVLNSIFLTYLDFISPELFARSREALKVLYFSNSIILTNLLLGLSMFASTIITFQKRKLYLE